MPPRNHNIPLTAVANDPPRASWYRRVRTDDGLGARNGRGSDYSPFAGITQGLIRLANDICGCESCEHHSKLRLSIALQMTCRNNGRS